MKSTLGSKIALSNKVIAQHSLNVFESLNAKPPGTLATLGLLAMQGAGLFIAVVMGLILAFTGHANLRDFAEAAVRQGQYSLTCGGLKHLGAGPVRPGNLIVTTFSKEERAARTYQDSYNSLLNRYEASIQEQTSPVAEASVITRARTPVARNYKKTFVIAGLFPIAGIALGVGIALLRELSSRERYRRWETGLR